jgi:hypothetical protein
VKIIYYEEDDIAVIHLRERRADTVGEIAGEDIHDPRTGKSVPGVVLHRDDSGELYEIEIYSKASKRLDLDDIEFRRVPEDHALDETETGGESAAS